MTPQQFIAYYRVSTDRQGDSGLGLEAQGKTVRDYLAHHDGELVVTYTEVESGKRNNRPELQKALEACRKEKATLVIAKLDRLGRNVAFISHLMESKVEFVAVDNPHTNKLMLHMLAALAEHERDRSAPAPGQRWQHPGNGVPSWARPAKSEPGKISRRQIAMPWDRTANPRATAQRLQYRQGIDRGVEPAGYSHVSARTMARPHRL